MMPSPNLPTPSAPPASVAGGGQTEQLQGEDLKRMLTEVIGRVKQMADQNGIDFNELVAGVSVPPDEGIHNQEGMITSAPPTEGVPPM